MAKPLTTLFAVTLIASPALAQNPTTANQTTSAPVWRTEIAGVVIDSLNGRYLAGADVMIEGARRNVQTDSVGRFVIDSLPPGTYQVGVFHPVLDTLGLSLATQPFRLGPDSATTILLAVPSAATLVNRACAQRNGPNVSAIIGRVLDPETLVPVPHAEVSLAWTDIEVSKISGIVRTPRLYHDSTDELGSFRLCGLPSSLRASLQARHGSVVTGELPVSLGDRPVELLARTVMLPSSPAPAMTGNAKVSGVVTLDGSESKAGTRVELEGTEIFTMTNEKGEFTLSNLPSGSKVLVARRLGFGAGIIPVDLTSREEQRVNVELPRFMAVMDPVLVNARKLAALDKVGFNQRRKSSYGHYITPDQLESMRPTNLTDILRNIPGVRVMGGPHGDFAFSSRTLGSGCIRYFIDDVPYEETQPGDINTFVAASRVVAVEAYQETMVPPQFVRPGTSCTTVVLWTRFKIRK